MSDDSRYTLKYVHQETEKVPSLCEPLYNARCRLTSTVRLHLMCTTQEYSTLKIRKQ